jgi:predicted acyl esterase
MAWTWLQRDPRDRDQWPIHPVQTSWLKQPMLLLGGWWDPHLSGVLKLWEHSNAAGGSPELMVGPATHLEWWPGVQTQLLRFFNQHLKAADTSAPLEGRNFGTSHNHAGKRHAPLRPKRGHCKVRGSPAPIPPTDYFNQMVLGWEWS